MTLTMKKKSVILLSNSQPRHKKYFHQFTQHCLRAAEMNVRVHRGETALSTSAASIIVTHKTGGQNDLRTYSTPFVNVMLSARESMCLEESKINQNTLRNLKKSCFPKSFVLLLITRCMKL